eukprot:scaffold20119_cov20-Tisochrysis_lutea.AAC.4
MGPLCCPLGGVTLCCLVSRFARSRSTLPRGVSSPLFPPLLSRRACCACCGVMGRWVGCRSPECVKIRVRVCTRCFNGECADRAAIALRVVSGRGAYIERVCVSSQGEHADRAAVTLSVVTSGRVY